LYYWKTVEKQETDQRAHHDEDQIYSFYHSPKEGNKLINFNPLQPRTQTLSNDAMQAHDNEMAATVQVCLLTDD
jgi:hypothetical protein